MSLYGILERRKVADKYNPYDPAGLIYIFADFESMLLIARFNILELLKAINEAIYLILLALLPTAIGYTLYLRSLKDLKPYETQILALLEPIVATILGIFLFKEYPPITSVISGGLVCLSIIYYHLRF
ncbi:MAG: EamA family transporter [Candidatus Njordarchaeia archaeon]